MNNPESISQPSNAPFEIKKESEVVLAPHQRFESYANEPVEPSILEEIDKETLKRTRTFLISHPGLLQDDLAKVLNISLLALEASTERPEQVTLKDHHYDFLSLSALGRVVIERRQIHIAKIAEVLRANRETKLQEQEIAQTQNRLEAQKKRMETRRKNKRRVHSQAERLRKKSLKETMLQHQSLDDKRRAICEQKAIGRAEKIGSIAASLTDYETPVLPLLQLEYKDAGQLLGGHSASYIEKRVRSAKNTLGLVTREQLAVWAFEHGIEFELPTAPNINNLPIRDRQVAALIHEPYPKIRDKLGLSNRQIHKAYARLLEATGAANKSQLALIAQAYHFEPFPEELEDNTPEILKQFTLRTQQCLQIIHHSTASIAKELGTSKAVVWQALNEAKKAFGVENYEQLALFLANNGIELDIKQPKKPIREILSKDQLKVARLAHLEVQEIQEILGMNRSTIFDRLSLAKKRLGARSRPEVALMIRAYDDGKDKEDVQKTREEVFFELIDIPPIPKEQALAMLQALTPKYITENQADCIRDYYLAEEDVSWAQIASMRHTTSSAPDHNARQGIKKLKSILAEERERRTNPDYIPPRMRELFARLNIKPVPLEDVRKNLLDALGSDSKYTQYVEAYYLSGRNYDWEEMSSIFSIKKESISKMTRVGADMLKEYLEQLQGKNT